ncbi:HAD superfamily hydrolase (TIGR01509 family) [Parabacteroides sp. PF5-5]|uniref:HAD family hydrolase n=1 Tax=unclassified Parabacteroides TaxID=2649774 RepID=UPI00247510B1|nr:MULTISPECIES: HAD family hydrolase [unclassified Parabacteroides]MDH6304444.1 HAD superfamily hydrolase (TIGR01509 family) [Parabacteroides sp. PH5-39]MDH6315403.1 HAD superfamily hydrolase (TIGR01509 family) [Parabacteroides sp. PF5-13]MDH6319103.1 HAD superfamily hydrolase (TIGR01509 family) [Parabacteroides sp. PH5-13]MDH6322833.1 HAD superfamily hydrolase (TIGR01509 family) [Parabacteroides sp. PH5-8]MDH6326595.1 HAD superfamily hydrolase (TIGR01509 family) [Parabacteroides sp. PH5-41]
MLNLEKIKGIIFDYGGTIDSNGMHWAEVIWMSYEAIQIPVTKEVFREAYVHGERTLAKNRIVLPNHNFWHVLRLKAETQIQWLIDNGHLPADTDFTKYTTGIADWCYAYSQTAISAAIPVLKKLAEKYPMVLVSNFYGNIEAVLKDFHLSGFFQSVVESSVVGVRKPDPAIFTLGVEQLGLLPEEIVVIGDSYDKDMEPAAKVGCQTVWLKGLGWSEYTGQETADAIIADFQELKELFQLQ